MSGPPLPPRPPSSIAGPPPLPPHPTNYHGEDPPLAAPRPQKYASDVPGDISRTLDEFSQYPVQAPSAGPSHGHAPSLSITSPPLPPPFPIPVPIDTNNTMAYRPPPPPHPPTGPGYSNYSGSNSYGGLNPNPGFADPRGRSPGPSPGGQGPPPMWGAGAGNANQYGGYASPPPSAGSSRPYSPPQQPPYGNQGPVPQWQAPPQQQQAQPWRQNPSPRPVGPPQQSLNASMAALSFNSPPPSQPSSTASHSRSPPPGKGNDPPSLTARLPTIATLSVAINAVQARGADAPSKVAWCRDVLQLVERSVPPTSDGDPPTGPITLSDANLQQLVAVAVPMVLSLASAPLAGSNTPIYVAEAIYLRAGLEANGYFPEFGVDKDPRKAFRDFEQAARAGYSSAWFKLGRDYENFGDSTHARDCFERGVRLGVESCVYRMGMAHLLGQLGLPSSHELAVPLLHRAATLATITCPQPAYVYALLLLGEFSYVTVPPALFIPFLTPALPSGPATPPQILEEALQNNARAHLERAAYLAFAPAQYKLGHAYEFANPPFPYDPLLSVQYYSLASQQGETEADMALSKWFLCGADGAFDKDESLAWTFAEKAARKGLASAEFAMGYYAEVGVGGPANVEEAKRWYAKAASNGNEDAPARLAALNQATPQALSRQEHDAITENKLLRKRTQAQQRSNTRPPDPAPPLPSPGGPLPSPGGSAPKPAAAQPPVDEEVLRPNVERVVGVARRASQMRHPVTVGRRPGTATPQPQPTLQSQPPPQQQPRPSAAADYGRQGPSAAGPGYGSGPPQGEFGEAPPAGSAGRRAPGAQHKYTLSDTGFQGPAPGSGGAAPAPQHQNSTFRPPGQRPQIPGREASAMSQQHSQQLQDTPPPAPKPPATPGLTFEQMGIQSGKVEDEKCVIM